MENKRSRGSEYVFPNGAPIDDEFKNIVSQRLTLREFALSLVKERKWQADKYPIWRIRFSESTITYIQLAAKKKARKKNENINMLPTLIASEGYRSNSRELTTESGKIKNVGVKSVSYGVSISQLAEQGFLPTPTARLWKANCSVDRKKGHLEDTIASVLSEQDKTAKINPIFLSEMMGFPLKWVKLPFQTGT